MDELIDSLAGALPLIIVALWVIRLISRRSNAVKQAAAEKAAKTAVQAAVPEAPDLSEAPDIREALPVSDSEGRTPGQETKAAVRQSKAAEENIRGRNTVEDTPIREDWHSRSGSVSSEPADRFENLSPLARGMVWSIILDKPPALKDP